MSDVDLARRNDIPTRHCQWKRNTEDPTCATENGLMIESSRLDEEVEFKTIVSHTRRYFSLHKLTVTGTLSSTTLNGVDLGDNITRRLKSRWRAANARPIDNVEVRFHDLSNITLMQIGSVDQRRDKTLDKKKNK